MGIYNYLKEKIYGETPTPIEQDIITPDMPKISDFSDVNQNQFSEPYYRNLERIAQIESKKDVLDAIEYSLLSRQTKDGLIMFVKNELDSNMMYSDLSEGEDKAIAYLKTKVNVIISTISPAYKSDRKNPFFVYVTSNILNQSWRMNTRATGKDRERTISARTQMKFEGTHVIQKAKNEGK